MVYKDPPDESSARVMQEQRVAVVVGASGGLGGAFVQALLDDSDVASVVALSRQQGPTGDARLRWLTVDPEHPERLAEAVAAIREATPRIHLLLICTGILHLPGMSPEKSLRQLDLQQFERTMRVNALVPLQVLAAFAPLLTHPERAVAAALSAKVGSIGDNRLGGWYGYRMSKAALNMGLKTASIELARGRPGAGSTGPIVVAVHPGTTISPLSSPFLARHQARPAADSAVRVLEVLDRLGPGDSGKFYNWDGSELPW
jgi:NAD(P)-dependent dehydrogenase (short-subunit alcohol dehydrogenase family)